MAMRKEAGISDEAVRAKTGRTWGEWFAILDGAGARKLEIGRASCRERVYVLV